MFLFPTYVFDFWKMLLRHSSSIVVHMLPAYTHSLNLIFIPAYVYRYLESLSNLVFQSDVYLS